MKEIKSSSKLFIQLIILLALLSLVGIFTNNLLINLIRTDMELSFNWLTQPAGFALGETLLPFRPTNSYAWALLVGWMNSLQVIIAGLFLATILGVVSGTVRTGSNTFLKNLAQLYVALIRQVPLLIQLLFWYFVVLLNLSETPLSIFNSLIKISNQGIIIFGLKLSVEFTALLLGLSVFTGASIAEIVRGGINSVSKGQWEAFRSLGLSEALGVRKVILPQALPAILPGLTSQYLNLAKNSTLAIAIGYSDIYAVSDTTITQTGRAIEGFIVLIISFLILNILISGIMEHLNKYILKSVQRN